MKSIIIIFFIAIISSCLTSCKEKVETPEQFMKWLENDKNGCVQKKTVGGIDLKVKYLPAEALLISEMAQEQLPQTVRDSLLTVYNTSRTFLLTIGPNKTGGEVDIMLSGIANEVDFAERATELNFNMAEYIELKAGNKIYRPVLANLENVYGLSNSRNFYLVFAPEKENDELFNAKELTLSYKDRIFETGINNFRFSKKSLDNIPELGFLNYN